MVVEVSSEELTDAMEKYGYSISFRDSRTGKRKTVKDLNATGYLMLCREKGVESIDTELQYYKRELVEGTWCITAVVKSILVFEGKVYSALADADDTSQSVRGNDMVVRSTDTLAFKRAAARALGINRNKLQNFKTADELYEEEPYTPMPRSDEEEPLKKPRAFEESGKSEEKEEEEDDEWPIDLG